MIAILGAGLAGLSAAYELIEKGVPGKEILIFEKEDDVGGLAQTKSYNGFRFDLGPHRWFTKSVEIDRMWEKVNSPDILEVERLTRIWYQKSFFNYPLSPMNVLKNFGIAESSVAIFTYLLQAARNRLDNAPPKNMEEAFIRQFGPVLYRTFFKDYNQKLWGGAGCRDLSPDWVKQRVKNLSLAQALLDAIGLSKKGTVVSLVEHFKYPSGGTGQLSERMMSAIKNSGGTVVCSSGVKRVIRAGNKLTHVIISRNGKHEEYEISYCISSIPIDFLVNAIYPEGSSGVVDATKGLRYRHLIFVVLFVEMARVMKDNWLYVQDPSVSFNRFMDMASWNPSLSPAGRTSLIFEITSDFGDSFWSCPDVELVKRVREEFVREFGFVENSKIIEGKVYRKTHAYPVYGLDYKKRLDVIKSHLGEIENLQLIGRNGLFRYNNMDHSIASGIGAAKNYIGENVDIESINLDMEYQEEIKNPSK